MNFWRADKIDTPTRGSIMKKTAFLVLLTFVAAADAQAVARRGVQRPNILQLLNPTPKPAPTPAPASQPVPVVTPAAPAPAADPAPTAPVDPAPAP